MGIFDLLNRANNAFFDGLKANAIDRALAKGRKARKEAEAIAEIDKIKKEEEELDRILSSMPTPRIGDGKATDEIMQLILNYVKSRGETKDPVIDDFIDLNKNEGLNIRIRTMTGTGRFLINDYRSALLKAGKDQLKTPADVETIINKSIKADVEEESSNPNSVLNLEHTINYLQNNYKRISKYFYMAARSAAIEQNIDPRNLIDLLKIGDKEFQELLEQLESAGLISQNVDEITYAVHLETPEDMDEIISYLEFEKGDSSLKYFHEV